MHDAITILPSPRTKVKSSKVPGKSAIRHQHLGPHWSHLDFGDNAVKRFRNGLVRSSSFTQSYASPENVTLPISLTSDPTARGLSSHLFPAFSTKQRERLGAERERRRMGLLTNKMDREGLKPADHIYTYRAVFAYSHHGIFVGGSKVVHFRPEHNLNPSSPMESFSSAASSSEDICPTFPDCGFRQPNSGVVLSCLDCFLKNGSLYCFEYGVSPSVFLTKVRGGTCTTAQSDPTDSVIQRAMHLLQNGFGNYDIFKNNCEDFALYCKTGLLIMDKLGVGRSGQASSIVGAPLAAILSSPFKLLIPSPIGVATVTAGMYCMSRYATDIGVRTDVVKVSVEDLALNLDLKTIEQVEEEEEEDSDTDFVR